MTCFGSCFLLCLINALFNSGSSEVTADVATTSVQSDKRCNCFDAEPCFWDDTCPGLGCGAVGVEKCRYCGFAQFKSIRCPNDLKQLPSPPSCIPQGSYDCFFDGQQNCHTGSQGIETNTLSQASQGPFFTNQVSAPNGDSELDECTKVTSKTNTLFCSSTLRNGQEPSPKTLQQLHFSSDCKSIDKTIWFPPNFEGCTVKCHQSAWCLVLPHKTTCAEQLSTYWPTYKSGITAHLSSRQTSFRDFARQARCFIDSSWSLDHNLSFKPCRHVHFLFMIKFRHRIVYSDA